MWMMCWLAAACFVVPLHFCFSACLLPSTTLAGIGGRYDKPHVGRCGIACRWAARCDQHKEPQPAMGAQSWSTTKSRLSFPGRGFLNVVWVPFVVLCWFIWPELRCWGFRNNLVWARLLEDVVELVYMGYPLSVIRGLVHSLPCSRVALIGRKTVRMWLFLCKNRMVLDYEMDPKQKHRPRREMAGGRRGSRSRRGSSVEKALPGPPAFLGECGE